MSRRYSIFRPSQDLGPTAESVATRDYPMKLYMDESGNGNRNLPLLVGAIATDVDAADVENEIRHLYQELSARRSLSGLPSFEEFRKNGFHAKNDPFEISIPFLELIQKSIGFKAYVYFTDRSNHSNSPEPDQIEHLYSILVADNLIRYRFHSEVYCLIEENSELRDLVRKLPSLATKMAAERLGRNISLPPLHVKMIKKSDAMSLAIIDYIMMAISRWIRKGYTRDVKDRDYRYFREIQPTLSLLYSVEQGMLLNRKVHSGGS